MEILNNILITTAAMSFGCGMLMGKERLILGAIFLIFLVFLILFIAA